MKRAFGFGVIASLVAFVLLLLPAAPVRAELFPAESFMLANGMQVVVLPNHRAPVVVHMVWYRVGAADDPPGKSGGAHFLEHLMFKGTAKHGPGEFSRMVADNGGSENAFTSADYTGYFQKVARDRLEMVMELEADRMRNLILTDAVITPERQVIIEERNSRIDNDPSALLQEQMEAALYVRHPFGSPNIGWRVEMEGLDRETALSVYRQYYAPDNAILIVAGDITAAELKPLAEKYYGVIKPSGIEARQRLAEPTPLAERRVILRDARVTQPSLMRAYLAPSAASNDRETATALSVLSDILGSNTTSRLYRSLTVEQKKATYAGSSYDSLALDWSGFYVYAAPLPETSMTELEVALDAAIADLLKNGVTETELKESVTRMKARAIYALDDPQAIANIFGSVLAIGLTVDDIQNWPMRLDAVTVDRINAAARAILKLERSVTGQLLPKTEG
ncbi:MAG: insulinase family protein [Alphaproteobacteria bacterium]|nr:insulinase family protein [Alphaproteobacteria bacterium]